MPVELLKESDIELQRKSSLAVCSVLSELASILKPGVTGNYLNTVAEEMIASMGGKPSFKGYRGFPAALCISPNDMVVHGIPNDIEFKDGDLVSIDCGILLNGFHGDVAFTFLLDGASKETVDLCKVTYDSLMISRNFFKSGNRIGDYGAELLKTVERDKRYGIVRELIGHGVGRNLHQDPEVPNFGKKGSGPLCKEGMVLAVEPMINLGSKRVKQLNDGWSIVTFDGKPSAHYEHNLVVRKNHAEFLSNHDDIHEKIKINRNLVSIL